MLKAENIKKKYGSLEVLKGISLEVKKGEIISIVGASGAGKSTLLHILGTLDKPDEGQLFMNNTLINTLNGNSLSKFRNEEIGFVFQFHNLLPEFSAFENICMPGMIAQKNVVEVEKRANELMQLLRIDHRKNHKPSEMSGGEQQRASVARALINNPAIIFADEPSGNLDSANADELHELFFKLREELEQTFVIVTHNKGFAQMADRLIEIKDGMIKV
ncbi:ABC transporter ATP-binding protein [Chondrinema litorale]|uniref:ABC transporter ATP-binding protein n=1 Tax=Chondrinema litorale TaxID=2994555 RepID=UPI002543421A|nr:ABC transporter ATP-binding protein [Chondrinema litorale]UZR94165.1 ABC transporter ATP-binding protein [Chondrinema litorale]